VKVSQVRKKNTEKPAGEKKYGYQGDHGQTRSRPKARLPKGTKRVTKKKRQPQQKILDGSGRNCTKENQHIGTHSKGACRIEREG